jgi:sulfur relay (sulfurtransferase) DsrC/TusE family protein
LERAYTSRYTDKPITVAQYLAERVCERLAQKDKVDLPAKFWNLTKWKRTFLYQVQLANGLLKIYKPEAIVAALRKQKNIYSLGAKFLDPLIRVEQEDMERKEVIAKKAEDIPQPEPVNTVNKPRPRFTEKKSILNKLREL